MAKNETEIAEDGAQNSTPKSRKPDPKRLLIVLVVVLLAASVLYIASRDEEPQVKAEDGVTLVPVEDREGGYSIELPTNWQLFEQEQEDPQIRMVAGDRSGQNNVRIRVSPLAQPVIIDSKTPDSVLAEFQAQFDKYIDDGENVREVIQRQRVNINGLQGWWYLYSFNDSRGQEEGLHSHFFLMGGSKLYVLVFQTLPASAYKDLAGTFDKMIASFKLLQPVASPPVAPVG